MMVYPWYELITRSEIILQGDFVPECPIIIPPTNFEVEVPEVEVQLIDAIIMSQSCDLVNSKAEIALVAPYVSLKYFLDSMPEVTTHKAKNKIIETLRKGHMPGYHLLNKWDKYLQDYQVVDFSNVYGINVEALKNKCKEIEHLRLLPPYREHLSQAFARYFMRVGLPQDLIIEGY